MDRLPTKPTAWASVVLLALNGCGEPHFNEGMTLGGVEVSAEVLNQGYEAYTHYCRACHGAEGDGKGPASYGLRPPPRDFTEATFKFAAVEAGELPNDDDFYRIIKNGLHGTAMLPWDVPEEDLQAIIQYIKTFSDDWQDYEPGDPIVTPEDPWQGRLAEATERGDKLYHGFAQCFNCHPAYATQQEIYAANLELRDTEVVTFRPDLYGPVLTDTNYGYRALPPDFLQSPVRSGDTPADFFRVIASGVGGTAMPTWYQIVEDDDIWAMAHFVRSLVDLSDDAAAVHGFRDRMANQAELQIPEQDPNAAG